MSYWRRLLICVVLVSSTLQLQANCWYSYIEGQGWGGDWHQGGGANLFVPFWQDCQSLLFVEGRAQRLRHQWIGSGGLGWRSLISSNFAYGINGFIDFSHADFDQDYVQFGVGAELFGPCWEARINGYILDGTHSNINLASQTNRIILDGINVVNQVTSQFDETLGYAGFDVEGGAVLPFGPGYARGYAGYFYYGTSRAPDIQGPRVRLQYDWDDPFRCCGVRFSVGWQWTYDQVRHTQSAGFAILRIPLGCKKVGRKCWKSSLCRRLNDPVLRELGVVFEDRRFEEVDDIPIIGPDGDPLKLIFVDRLGGGIGTQTDPTTLDNAEAISGPSDVIFALNDEGDIDVNNTFTMQVMQQLLGFGNQSTRLVVFDVGLVFPVTDLTGSGRATLTRDGGDNIVTAAEDAFICGIRLDEGNNGIEASGINDVRIEDVIFDNSGNNGVNGPGGITNFSIQQATFNNIGASALFLEANSPSIRNVAVDTTGGPAIHLTNTTFPSLSNVTVNQAGAQGLLFDGTSSNLSLSAVVATDSAQEGFFFDGVASLSMSNNSAATGNATGLRFNNVTGQVSIASTNVTDNTVVGIDIFGGTADYLVANSTLSQLMGGTAIDIDSTAGMLNLTGLTIDSAFANGVNALRVTNTTGGPIDFNGASLLHVVNADGAFFDANQANISLDQLTVGVTNGDGVVANMGDGDITFRQLNVDMADNGVVLTATAADDGAFTVTGDGMTADSGGTITHLTGEGVRATDVAGVDLNFMNINSIGSDAIVHTTANRTDATFTLNQSTVVGGQSGIDLDVNTTGGVTALVTNNIVRGTNAAAYDALVADTATLLFAIDGNTFASTNDAGLRLSNTTGTLANSTVTNFANSTVVGSATGTGGILVDNTLFAAPGQVSGGSTQIGTTTTRVENDGLSLDQVDGDLFFTVLDVANNNGTGLFIRDAGGKGGDFMFGTGGGTIDTTNGTAIDIDPVDLDVTLDSVSSTNSPGSGILLNTCTGSFTVTGATTITNPTDNGIEILNGDVDTNFNTIAVTGAGIHGISLTDYDGMFGGGTATMNMITNSGFFADGGTGTAQFTALEVDTAERGAMAQDFGGLTVTGDGSTANSGGTIQNVTEEGIDLQDLATISLSFMNVASGATRNAVQIGVINGNTVLTLDSNVMTGDQSGLAFFISGTATAQAAIDRNTFTGMTGFGAEVINFTATNSNVQITSLDSNTVLGTGSGLGGIQITNTLFDAPGPVPGGITQIGTPSARVEGDGLILDPVDGNLFFTSLSIGNNNGTGLFIRDFGGKAGDFMFETGGGTIDTTTGAAIDIDPVDLDVTLASVTSTNSPTSGILLNTCTGSFTVTGATTITNPTNDGIEIFDGDVAATFNTIAVTNAGMNGISLMDYDGVFDGGTTTVDTATDAGLAANGATGTAQFTALNVDNAEFGVNGQDFGGLTITGDGSTPNSGGTIQNVTQEGINLLDVDVISLSFMNVGSGLNMNAVAIAAFNSDVMLAVDNNILDGSQTGLSLFTSGTATSQAAIDRNTLTGMTGFGLEVINFTGTNSNAQITSLDSNTVEGSGGSLGGITITDTLFDAPGPVPGGTTQIGTTANRVLGFGLGLDLVEGELEFDALNIANQSGIGLNIADSGPRVGTFTFRTTTGVIDTDLDKAIAFAPTDLITVDTTFATVNSTNSVLQGMSFNRVTGTVDIQGGSITNPPGAAVLIGMTTDLDFTHSGTITNVAAGMLDISDATGGTIIFNGSSYVDSGDLTLLVLNSTADVSLTNTMATGAGATGLELQSATGSFTVTNSTIDDRDNGIFGNVSGDVTIENVVIDGTRFTGISLADITGDLDIMNCTIQNVTDTAMGTPVAIRVDNTDTAVTANISNNTISTIGSMNLGNAIEVQLTDTATGIFNLSDNTTTTTEQSAILANLNATAGGSLSINITDHSDTNSDQAGGNFAAYVINNNLSPGSICADLMGNNTNNNAGIDLTNTPGGTFDVAGGVGNLSANNNNINVSTTGTFGNVASCPTSLVP